MNLIDNRLFFFLNLGTLHSALLFMISEISLSHSPRPRTFKKRCYRDVPDSMILSTIHVAMKTLQRKGRFLWHNIRILQFHTNTSRFTRLA